MPRAQFMVSQADEESTTLFVGNLAEQVTEELLYELFLQVGPLASVKIPNDNKGGKCCYGFIRFKHVCSPDYAIDLLQGTSLFSRSINLQRRNKGGNNQRQKPPQQDHNRQNSYNDSYSMGKQRDMPETRHIHFDSEPNFDRLLEMSATLANTPNMPGGSRDYRGRNDNRRFNENKRSFDNSNRSFDESNRNFHDNQRGSRGFGNRDRGVQEGYDNRRNNSNDFSPNGNDRSYDDRRGNSGGKSNHKHNRSHDRRPYDSRNRNRGRY